MVEFKGLGECADFVRTGKKFRVIGHYDADGISATAIAAAMLERAGKEYDMIVTPKIDAALAQKAGETDGRLIFVDLGSSSLSILEDCLKGRDVCILDHHKPEKETSFLQFNPHLFGYDGSEDLSGSGAAYFVAKEVDEKNIDMSKIAVVGAVGDMQDQRGALKKLNRLIVDDGEGCGELEEKTDIRLFGRNSRPLVQFLSYATYPYLPGLTANEAACTEFINSLGIPLSRGGEMTYYVDLDEGEKKRFISALYVYGKQRDLPEESLRGLVGKVYELTREKPRTEIRDAKEFSTMLNACGRHDEWIFGVKVCMGDRDEYYKKAKSLLQKHRQMLRDGIEWAQHAEIRRTENLYVMDARGHIPHSIVGTVSGMLYSAKAIKQDKPVVGLSVDDEGIIKVSTRGNWALIGRGLHLGEAVREAAKGIGAGGGHNIAAGASVQDPADLGIFMQRLEDAVGRQLTRRQR